MITTPDSYREFGDDAARVTAAKRYRSMSQRLPFGEGGEVIQNYLLTLRSKNFNLDNRPDILITGAWIDLELHQHTRRQGIDTATLIESARDMFQHALETTAYPSEPGYDSAELEAAMGLVYLNSLSDPLQTVVEDNAALYEKIALDLVEKKTRGGYIAEALLASLLSEAGMLILPAPHRIEKSLSIELPNARYDLQGWTSLPDSTLTRPDRKIQVKLGKGFERSYDPSIHVINVYDITGPGKLNGKLDYFEKYYDGQPSKHGEASIKRMANTALRLAMREPGIEAPTHRRAISLRSKGTNSFVKFGK